MLSFARGRFAEASRRLRGGGLGGGGGAAVGTPSSPIGRQRLEIPTELRRPPRHSGDRHRAATPSPRTSRRSPGGTTLLRRGTPVAVRRAVPAVARALPERYVPGVPQRTVLYRIVREHLATFLDAAAQHYDAPLPDYVLDEFREYQACGQFGPGFLRCHCDACGHDMLIAFSCKRRGVCPSCGTRRMCNEAAHLTDRVFPNVPVRQWVLSLPFELRRMAAFRADVLTALGRLFVDEIFRAMNTRSRDVEGGAVTFVQRFGGSLNLNVHFHVLVLDGAYVRREGTVRFREHPAPSRDQIERVAKRVHGRAVKWLRRHGLLRGNPEDGTHDPEQATALDACATLALRGAGLVSGIADRSERQPSDPLEARPPKRFSAVFEGFDVHAAVRVEADDDAGRERLVRYCARPALALDRLSLSPAGDVVYRVKYARGNKTHRIMAPIEFLARLAALIPPPRYPLVRYHGVLAPHSAWRKAVVPKPVSEQRAHHTKRDVTCVVPPQRHSGSVVVASPCGASAAVEVANGIITVHHWGRLLEGVLIATSPRVAWAELLRRTHGVDVLVCPRCRGRLRLLAAITDPDAARRILRAIGVDELDGHPEAPPVRARAPDAQLTLPW